MRFRRTLEIVLFAVLFLLFLQVLSDFIQSIYAFGLLVTAFTIQIASILLLFTPLLLLVLRKPLSRPRLIDLTSVAIAGRLMEPVLDPGSRLVACGVSVGAFMLLFPLLIANGRSPEPSPNAERTTSNAETPQHTMHGWTLASSMLIALSLSVFLRAGGSSFGLSESGIYYLLPGVLAVLAFWMMQRYPDLLTAASPPVSKAQEGPLSTGRVTGLCIGLASVIIMLYFGFMNPAVIARWTGYSYPAIVGVLVLALTVFALLLSSTAFTGWLSRPVTLGWNALFVLMLVLTILPHQIAFPAAAQAYPLDAPAVSPLAMLPLFLMLLLSPVIFIDLALYAGQLSDARPSIRQLGLGFSLAALFILMMVFFHVFTSIYDYAPVVGPLFRDRFWLVYLLAGLGLALPLSLLRQQSAPLSSVPGRAPFAAIVVVALALCSIGAVELTAPKPPPAAAPTAELRVMTYNIQQGFDKVGKPALDDQLDVIRQVAPDVLGLQESDTARVANGNVDAVRFFADHLGMQSYYGPTTTTGTFGIALLSKYPIQQAQTFFMYSTGEQTAAIQARITINGRTYNIFVTHLGNDGPMVQLQNVLQRFGGLPDVILIGDLNFNPTTPQYALATRSLADAWLLRWPAGKDIPGLGQEDRIDHIFVSPGTVVAQSEYVVNPASDHPYLYAVVRP